MIVNKKKMGREKIKKRGTQLFKKKNKNFFDIKLLYYLIYFYLIFFFFFFNLKTNYISIYSFLFKYAIQYQAYQLFFINTNLPIIKKKY